MKKDNRDSGLKFEQIFEEDLKERLNKFLYSGKPSTYLVTALLVAAALGGIITVGAVAPNLFSAFGRMRGRSQKISKEGFYKLRQSFYQLRRRGWIEYVDSEQRGDIYRVNENGKKHLVKFMFNNLFVPKPKYWDRKWRVVIFDVPHSRKKAREALRNKLKDMDFFQLQKSVWVHPFPCENEIWYVADVFAIRPCIEVLTVDNFNNLSALNSFRSLLQEFL